VTPLLEEAEAWAPFGFADGWCARENRCVVARGMVLKRKCDVTTDHAETLAIGRSVKVPFSTGFPSFKGIKYGKRHNANPCSNGVYTT
jgi:hypothetical protein